VTRVLIVDDHPVVRSGLRAILSSQPDLHVVDEVEDGAAAVERALALRPDVVLMDLRLGGLDGQTATATIRRELPATAVLVLTVSSSEADVVAAIEAGATGYLLKDAPREELLGAVRAAARGDSLLAAPAMRTLMKRLRQTSRDSLSAREREVLELLAAGGSNKEIARRLHLTEATIKSHLIRIYSKLGVADRTSAVTTALGRGLIEMPAPVSLPRSPDSSPREPTPRPSGADSHPD
jgi:DNA-binding NarL/FixJ family response regulator